MRVLALVSDLMMQSQVSGAAQRGGVELRVVSNVESLCREATSGAVDLIVVDLSHPGLDPAALMEQLRVSSDTATLAFGPHVHKQRLQAAADAGFTAVMSRGQFHANMDDLLSGKLS